MRIAFLSDVHGNVAFLDKVLCSVSNAAADAVYCLGDMIGYYPFADEVVGRIRETATGAVCGNHEEYYLGRLAYDKRKEPVYRICDIELKKENHSYLESLGRELRFVVDGVRFRLAHAMPEDTERYIDLSVIREMGDTESDVYVYGHTHYAALNSYNGTTFLNPGSAGQVRDCSGTCSFALYDTVRRSSEIWRVEVDVAGFAESLPKGSADDSAVSILSRRPRYGR